MCVCVCERERERERERECERERERENSSSVNTRIEFFLIVYSPSLTHEQEEIHVTTFDRTQKEREDKTLRGVIQIFIYVSNQLSTRT